MADATITIIGNLTRDPELKFMDKTGNAAVKIGVAVTKKWKDRNGAEQEQTSFFDCSAFGSIAQNIADSLHKGDRVIVHGTLEQRSWETDKGEKRSAVEVKIEACGPDLRCATAHKGDSVAPKTTAHRYSEPEDAF